MTEMIACCVSPLPAATGAPASFSSSGPSGNVPRARALHRALASGETSSLWLGVSRSRCIGLRKSPGSIGMWKRGSLALYARALPKEGYEEMGQEHPTGVAGPPWFSSRHVQQPEVAPQVQKNSELRWQISP